MNSQIEKLIRLQTADEEIARRTQEIASLPGRLAALETKLSGERLALKTSEEALKKEEAARRSLEMDVKEQQQKIQRYREQLNTVKTNDQYKALQHEVSFAEAEIRRLEDVELESMERTEHLEQKRIAARAALETQTKAIETEKEHAHQVTAETEQRLSELKKERAELRASIEETILATYDRVASGFRKTGLARVQGQQCLGCQMFLRPQLWNQVRQDVLLTCESCGRLLYWDPALEPQPEAKKAEAEGKRKVAKDAGEASA